MKVIVNAKVKADVKLIANGRLVIVSTCYFVIIDINYPWIYKKCIEGRMEACYGE